MRISSALCGTLLMVSAAPAQEAPPVSEQLHRTSAAAESLSRRVLHARAQTHVAPVLVIVPDEGSYLAALSLWTPELRFPILIDDPNVFTTRQDIARFSRAFKPTSVVRFKAAAMPAGAAERQKALIEAVAEAWRTTPDRYAAVLNDRPAPEKTPKGPLGVVVTGAADPAWTAAAALAAAHGQLVVFTPPPSLPDARGTMSVADADRLSDAISGACEAAKVEYKTLGDPIDAVTLCLNIPLKVTVGASDAPAGAVRELTAKPGEALATTDLIGRAGTGNRAERWAWCGQIAGSAPRAAYMAMSAIFLTPERAFIFDGYDGSGAFGAFDGTRAGKVLKDAGVPVQVGDAPHNSADDWRLTTAGAFVTTQRRTAAGLPAAPAWGGTSAGFICVNTMGNHDFFQFKSNSKCYVGDVPILQTPAVLNFVHSWSLTLGIDPWAIGGRWLDHGVYAYVGSVHEPYLPAFVPTPDFCLRMAGQAPLGAAARVAEGPFAGAWRVAVLGDPLLVFGPGAPRDGTPPTLEGAADLATEPREWAKAKRYELALDALEMLNRGGDAARLAAAAIREDADHVDSEAALRGVLAAFNAGDFQTVALMAAKIEKPGERDANVADAIWQSLGVNLDSLDAAQARTLSRTLRPYSFAQDAILAARALGRAESPAAARAFFTEAKARATRPDIRKVMSDAESLLPR